MTTIGDNLLFFGSLSLISLTLWGTLLLFNILFPAKVSTSAHLVESSPARSILFGFLYSLPVLIITLILVNAPSPVIKLLAGLLFVAFVLCACVGMAGLARMIGLRVQSLHPKCSALSANGWGASLLVLFCGLPFLGWLILAPVALCLGFGLFVSSSMRRITAPRASGVS
ncbi:MAG: hypothetical protein MUC92_09455 [Fimbriimonadaceae bacterium]|nr:hypothetical protein [Fimbriimonadaceae bacterium]